MEELPEARQLEAGDKDEHADGEQDADEHQADVEHVDRAIVVSTDPVLDRAVKAAPALFAAGMDARVLGATPVAEDEQVRSTFGALVDFELVQPLALDAQDSLADLGQRFRPGKRAVVRHAGGLAGRPILRPVPLEARLWFRRCITHPHARIQSP